MLYFAVTDAPEHSGYYLEQLQKSLHNCNIYTCCQNYLVWEQSSKHIRQELCNNNLPLPIFQKYSAFQFSLFWLGFVNPNQNCLNSNQHLTKQSKAWNLRKNSERNNTVKKSVFMTDDENNSVVDDSSYLK